MSVNIALVHRAPVGSVAAYLAGTAGFKQTNTASARGKTFPCYKGERFKYELKYNVPFWGENKAGKQKLSVLSLSLCVPETKPAGSL